MKTLAPTVMLKAIDVKPHYFKRRILVQGITGSTDVEIVHRKYTADGAISFMLDNHCFFTAQPEEEIEVIRHDPRLSPELMAKFGRDDARTMRDSHPRTAVGDATAVFQKFQKKTSSSLSLAGLQAELAEWQAAQGFDAVPEHLGLGVAEEAGELSRALLKRTQGIRGMDDPNAFAEAAGDAVADITIYLMQLCTVEGWDFETLVRKTARRVVLKRDWVKNKKNGETVPNPPKTRP